MHRLLLCLPDDRQDSVRLQALILTPAGAKGEGTNVGSWKEGERRKATRWASGDDWMARKGMRVCNTTTLAEGIKYAVSVAVSKAGAAASGVPLHSHYTALAGRKSHTTGTILPVPLFRVIKGSMPTHSGTVVQEYLIIPAGASSFSEAVQMGSEVNKSLLSLIGPKSGKKEVENENEGQAGTAASLSDDTMRGCLELLTEAIDQAGCSQIVKIGMGASACTSYNHLFGGYNMDFKGANILEEEFLYCYAAPLMLEIYTSLIRDFDLVYLEDPFVWKDIQSLCELTSSAPIQIVGDELFASRPHRIAEAIEKKACNGLVYTIGSSSSISDSIATCTSAHDIGWSVTCGLDKGCTDTAHAADLAVGIHAGQIKTDISDRLAQSFCTRVVEIEEELGSHAAYAGSRKLQNNRGLGKEKKKNETAEQLY